MVQALAEAESMYNKLLGGMMTPTPQYYTRSNNWSYPTYGHRHKYAHPPNMFGQCPYPDGLSDKGNCVKAGGEADVRSNGPWGTRTMRAVVVGDNGMPEFLYLPVESDYRRRRSSSSTKRRRNRWLRK